ncbi:MAG: nitrate reductase subunit alpha, partial [Emcibacter sp.]|nr:nitrate reductase subunit alpha [Emcibacter sp.]
LPITAAQIWGTQDDVPETADWNKASYIMVWGSHVPQTRTPDEGFFATMKLKDVSTVAVTSEYNDVAKQSDIWLNPRPGTDAALAMAMGHVILTEYHLGDQSDYFDDYIRLYSDMPFLVRIDEQDGIYVAGRTLRAADFADNLHQENNPEWKPMVIDVSTNKPVIPNGTIGSRWGEEGKWNLESKNLINDKEIWPLKSLAQTYDEVLSVGFPSFEAPDQGESSSSSADAAVSSTSTSSSQAPDAKDLEDSRLMFQNIPVRKIKTREGDQYVATVYDLMLASYGVDNGLGGENVAASYEDATPYSPAWQEKITGVSCDKLIKAARAFAENADKTRGRSMIIMGTTPDGSCHMDMKNRAVINMLVMCGCIGKAGGGLAPFRESEKRRPKTGWQPLAFALDWHRPPRYMNGTSFFYNHADQWRYETRGVDDMLSPLAGRKEWQDYTLIDCNVRAERMGWMPSAPQLSENPLDLTRKAKEAGQTSADYIAGQLKGGMLRMSCEDPDNPKNFPRNLFLSRSDIFGTNSQGVLGVGHDHILTHLLGTDHGISAKTMETQASSVADKIPEQLTQKRPEKHKRPSEIVWYDVAPQGKLDLVVTVDFRLTTTGLYSDILLPSATHMPSFVQGRNPEVGPAWESRWDWNIYKDLAEKFSELCPRYLGTETDVVALPILHDTPAELAQGMDVKEWCKGEVDPIPGKTLPDYVDVVRHYPDTYKKFTALGPLMVQMGNGSKGISWDVAAEYKLLGNLNWLVTVAGVSKGMPRIETDIDAAEVILSLAPETNGQVAVKAWAALEKLTGRDHQPLAQRRKEGQNHSQKQATVLDNGISSALSSAISWGAKPVAEPVTEAVTETVTELGQEGDDKRDHGGYLNVHELIPWRTLTGRQQFYQDHRWMRDFGEALCVYKPQVSGWTIPWDQEGIPLMPVVVKPPHMIGGYAQLSYGFNYYGPAYYGAIGGSRDKFVLWRKRDQMEKTGSATDEDI